MLSQRTQKTYAPLTAVTRSMIVAPDLSRVQRLTESDRQEVFAFLSVRPVHTVAMTSFIIDNGIESNMNRGSFVGYRNACGDLEGVALIGHSTLIEARTDDAMQAFAIVARHSETPIHLIMSDGQAVETFWNYFSTSSHKPRLTCVEELFELSFPFLVKKCGWEVRFATLNELEAVAEAQAEVALLESGVDPMIKDRSGNVLPSVTRALAPTRQLAPIRAPLSTVAPMPMSESGPTLQPCTIAWCPTVQPAPRLIGKPGSACSSDPSWMLAPSPISIQSLSPRSTQPNQMPTSTPSLMRPITDASGATQYSPSRGRSGA